LASISPSELANQVLADCLAGRTAEATCVRQLAELAVSPDRQTAFAASQALFRDVAEALADRFEPELCLRYAEVFSWVLATLLPELDPARLLARYSRIRARRPYIPELPAPERVFVLSRVTLGADVAVSSVLLDALKRRFPAADIYLVGPAKNWELFSRDSRVLHLPVEYDRHGLLRERVLAGWQLREQFADPRCLVVDPDSRITQLGLLPVCDERRYYFFESRSYGAPTDIPLTQLTQQWVAETFGVPNAVAYVAPREDGADEALGAVTVSFGVGDNAAKSMGPEFEARLLRELAARGCRIVLDLGASPQDRERARHAIENSGVPPNQLICWDGTFAPFAARIAKSRLYIGYDSAGGHVAAACRVPLITIFRGHACERMYERWRPVGAGPRRVIKVGNEPWQVVLGRTLSYVDELLG